MIASSGGEIIRALKLQFSKIPKCKISTGRDALAGDSGEPFPEIVITPIRDIPEVNTRPTNRFQTWTRHVAIEAYIRATAAWDEQAEELWNMMRRQLIEFPLPMDSITEFEFIPPDEGGDICCIRFLMVIPYTIHFSID